MIYFPISFTIFPSLFLGQNVFYINSAKDKQFGKIVTKELSGSFDIEWQEIGNWKNTLEYSIQGNVSWIKIAGKSFINDFIL